MSRSTSAHGSLGIGYPPGTGQAYPKNARAGKRTWRLLSLVLLAGSALGAPAQASAAGPAPSLPELMPAAERVRLLAIAQKAAVSTRVAGDAFLARPDVFEYLLDHPDFATHVTGALRAARYRIWRTPDGFFLDDGWGVTGHFRVAYAAHGARVMHAEGQYRHWLLPDIRGQAVVVLEYAFTPARDGQSRVSTVLSGFVVLDSRAAGFAATLLSPLAERKAALEARRLVRVFARVSRAIDENPAGVYEKLRERPGVPQRELEEFGRLLSVR